MGRRAPDSLRVDDDVVDPVVRGDGIRLVALEAHDEDLYVDGIPAGGGHAVAGAARRGQRQFLGVEPDVRYDLPDTPGLVDLEFPADPAVLVRAGVETGGGVAL